MTKYNFLLISFLFLFSMANAQQDAKTFDNMAEEKMDQKDFQYAMVLIEKAIALDSTNKFYYLRKADIAFELDGPREAIKAVHKAISLDSTYAESYNRAGSYFDSWGQPEFAIEMYDMAISHAKNDTIKYSYLANRGTAKCSKRDFEGGLEDFKLVLEFNPDKIGTLNNIAMAYDALGMSTESIKSLKRIIELDSVFIGPYANLGFIYSNMDSLDLAIKYFEKASNISPNDPLMFNNRGYVYYKKGDYDKALLDINQSIKIYPTNSYAYRNLALVFIATGDLKEACMALNYAEGYGFERRHGPEVSELISKYCKE